LLRRHTCPGGQRQGKPRTAAHNDTPHWRTAQVSREVNYLQTLSFCSRLTYKNNSKKNKRGNLKYSLGCVSFQLKHSSRRFGKKQSLQENLRDVPSFNAATWGIISTNSVYWHKKEQYWNFFDLFPAWIYNMF
jgi:hypothetical protein